VLTTKDEDEEHSRRERLKVSARAYVAGFCATQKSRGCQVCFAAWLSALEKNRREALALRLRSRQGAILDQLFDSRTKKSVRDLRKSCILSWKKLSSRRKQFQKAVGGMVEAGQPAQLRLCLSVWYRAAEMSRELRRSQAFAEDLARRAGARAFVVGLSDGKGKTLMQACFATWRNVLLARKARGSKEQASALHYAHNAALGKVLKHRADQILSASLVPCQAGGRSQDGKRTLGTCSLR